MSMTFTDFMLYILFCMTLQASIKFGQAYVNSRYMIHKLL